MAKTLLLLLALGLAPMALAERASSASRPQGMGERPRSIGVSSTDNTPTPPTPPPNPSDEIVRLENATVAEQETIVNRKMAKLFSRLTGWPEDRLQVESSTRTLFAMVPTQENTAQPGTIRLIYNPNFVRSLANDNQLAWVMLHEYYHQESTDFLDRRAAEINATPEGQRILGEIRAGTFDGVSLGDQFRRQLQTESDQTVMRRLLQEQFAIGTEFHSDLRALVHMIRRGYDPETVRDLVRTWLADDLEIGMQYLTADHPQARDRLHAIEALIEWARAGRGRNLLRYGDTNIRVRNNEMDTIRRQLESRDEALERFHQSREYERLLETHIRREYEQHYERSLSARQNMIENFFSRVLNDSYHARDERNRYFQILGGELNELRISHPTHRPTSRASWIREKTGDIHDEFERRFAAEIPRRLQAYLDNFLDTNDPEVEFERRNRFGRALYHLQFGRDAGISLRDAPLLASLHERRDELREQNETRLRELAQAVPERTLLTYPLEKLYRIFEHRGVPARFDFLSRHWAQFSPERRDELRDFYVQSFPRDQETYLRHFVQSIEADPKMALRLINLTCCISDRNQSHLPSAQSTLTAAQRTQLTTALSRAWASLSRQDFATANGDLDFTKWFYDLLKRHNVVPTGDLRNLMGYLADNGGTDLLDFYRDNQAHRSLLANPVNAHFERMLQRLQNLGNEPSVEEMRAFVYEMGYIMQNRETFSQIPAVRRYQALLAERVNQSNQQMLGLGDSEFIERATRAFSMALQRGSNRLNARQLFEQLPPAYDRYSDPKPLNPHPSQYFDMLAILGFGGRDSDLTDRLLAHRESIYVELFTKYDVDLGGLGSRLLRLNQRLPRQARLNIIARILNVSENNNKDVSISNLFRFFSIETTHAEVQRMNVSEANRLRLLLATQLTSEQALDFLRSRIAHWTNEFRAGRMPASEFLAHAREFRNSLSGDNRYAVRWNEAIQNAFHNTLSSEVNRVWKEQLTEWERTLPPGQLLDRLKGALLGRDAGDFDDQLTRTHREFSAPLLERLLANASLEEQLNYLRRADSSWVSEQFRARVFENALNSNQSFEDKMKIAELITHGNIERMNRFWREVVEPERYQRPFDSETIAEDIRTVYSTYYDARARKINDVANHFRLDSQAIETLEGQVFPKQSQALAYKAVHLFQAAIKKIIAQRTIAPADMIEAIRWLQGRREPPPELIREITREMGSEIPGFSRSGVEFKPEHLLHIYRNSRIEGRMAMLSDFLSPYHEQGLWHPENEQGRRLVLASMLDGIGERHAPLARLLLESYLEALDVRERGHIALAQFLAAGMADGSRMSDAERLKAFFEAKGGLWIKIGQLLAADPHLLSDDTARQILRTLNDQAAEPLRKELLSLLKESMGSEYSKVKSVEILRSGSINVTAVVELHNGERLVARMVRGEPDSGAQYERDDLNEMIRIMRSRLRSGQTTVRPSLVTQIANALEEYVHVLAESIRHEGNLENDRAALSLLRPNGERGIRSYHANYRDLGVSVRLVGEAQGRIHYGEGQADPTRLMLVPLVDDLRQNGNALSKQEDWRARKAMLRSELESLFRYGTFDPDGHLGNWLISRDPNNPDRLIVHRIDTAQALRLPRQDHATFMRLLRGLARRAEPGLVTLRQVSDGALIRDLLSLVDSSLSRRDLERLALEAWQEINRNELTRNPVRLLAEWKSRIRDKIGEGQHFRFSAGIQMAIKSLFITQQLLDPTEEGQRLSAAEIRERDRFVQQEFLRNAFGQGRIRQGLSALGTAMHRWVTHKDEGSPKGWFDKAVRGLRKLAQNATGWRPGAPPANNEAEDRRVVLNYVRDALDTEHGRTRLEPGEIFDLHARFPELRNSLKEFARHFFSREQEYRSHVSPFHRDAFEYLRLHDTNFHEFARELLGGDYRGMVIEHALHRRDGALFADLLNLWQDQRNNQGNWINDRNQTSRAWREFVAQELRKPGGGAFPLSRLHRLDLDLYREVRPHLNEIFAHLSLDGLIDLYNRQLEGDAQATRAVVEQFVSRILAGEHFDYWDLVRIRELWDHPRALEMFQRVERNYQQQDRSNLGYFYQHMHESLLTSTNVNTLRRFAEHATSRSTQNAAVRALSRLLHLSEHRTSALAALEAIGSNHANSQVRQLARTALARYRSPGGNYTRTQLSPTRVLEHSAHSARLLDTSGEQPRVIAQFRSGSRFDNLVLQAIEKGELEKISPSQRANFIENLRSGHSITYLQFQEVVRDTNRFNSEERTSLIPTFDQAIREFFNRELSNREWRHLIVHYRQHHHNYDNFYAGHFRHAIGHVNPENLDPDVLHFVNQLSDNFHTLRPTLFRQLMSTSLYQYLDRLERGTTSQTEPKLTLTAADVANLEMLKDLNHQTLEVWPTLQRLRTALQDPEKFQQLLNNIEFETEQARALFHSTAPRLLERLGHDPDTILGRELASSAAQCGDMFAAVAP